MPLDPRKLMKGQAGGAPQEGQRPRVTPEDFKGWNVQKHVLKTCLGKPDFMFPMAGAAGMAVWTVLFFNPWTVIPALACLGGASVSFLIRYGVNGQNMAIARVMELREMQRQQMVTDFDQVIAGCEKDNFADGADKAKELKEAYLHLQGFLNDHKQGNLDLFRSLAEDTFKQALATVTLAMNLHKAIDTVDDADLARNVKTFRKQLDAIDDKDSQRAKTLQMQIDANQKQLDLVQKKQDNLAEALAKAEQIHLAFQATYLELVQRGDEDPTEFLNRNGGAVHELNNTLEAARKVEARLRGDDSEQAAKDDKYARMANPAEK